MYEWMDRANCKGLDTELFFPRDRHDSASPRRVCNRCEVKKECGEYARRLDVRFGVWGGSLRGL